jgi:sugar/nucleoside kinase (ribokinase family)
VAEDQRPLVRSGLFAVVGPVFLDLVIGGLSAPPELGAEVFGSRFALSPGGFAIAAITLAREGKPVVLASVVGEDVLSDVLLRTLAGEGVAVDALVRYPDGLSITVAASTAEERAFITHPGAPARTAIDDAWTIALDLKPAHVHLAAGHPSAEAILHRALSGGATVSLSVGWEPDFLRSADLRRRMGEADVAAFNEREALQATGETDVEAALARLSDWGRAVLVTLGSRGALWRSGDERVAVPAVRAEAVDTTGAGDVFMATFLAATAMGAAPPQALRTAARVAARAVERMGGATGVPRGPLRLDPVSAAARGRGGVRR